MANKYTKRDTHDKHPKQPGSKSRKKLTKKEIAQLTIEFNEKQAYLKENLEEVTPLEYYRDMFPAGSFELENDFDVKKPNGLASVLIDQKQPGRRYNRIIFDDLAMIEELASTEFVVVPPIGFSGKKRVSHMAYCFYGMCIDLDDVGIDNIGDLLFQMENKLLPYASYIVNSGTGLHVVYLFDSPIPAMPLYFESLGKLKEALSDMIWNQYTSRAKEKQYQGIFQGYRMVGSPTKISDECRVTAYKCGEKVSLRYLNDFVSKENQCIFDDIHHTNLEEAREKWPEWYERRIIQGRPVGDYELSEKEKIRRRAWYESWKEKLKDGAYDGNRHYCIGVLFNYAMKAQMDIEEALEEALELIPYLNSLTKKRGNEFTESDVYCALVYAEKKYIKMGRHGIQKMTKIDIGETKRNGRSRESHLKLARYVRDEINGNKETWRNNDGAPTKRAIVRSWRKANPGGTKAECHRMTKLSRVTIDKWWE